MAADDNYKKSSASNVDWNDVYDEGSDWAERYWMQQQLNRDPKFYQVPLTPEQKWWNERAKEEYEYDPTRDWVGRYISQYLEGFGNNLANVDLKFRSPQLADQKFAGGFTYPKIDFSQMPKPWEYGYKAPNSTADAPPPPPPQTNTGQSRSGKWLQAAGGFASGAKYGSWYGGLLGALQSAVEGKQQRDKNWDASKKAWDEWNARYANAFTDSQGRPVPAPKNMVEYAKWFQEKYGKPYGG